MLWKLIWNLIANGCMGTHFSDNTNEILVDGAIIVCVCSQYAYFGGLLNFVYRINLSFIELSW